MQGSAGRFATLLLLIGAAVLSLVGAGLMTGAPAAAAGILPPSNPSANIPPDSSDWLTSIDGARSQEGVGVMNISESAFDALPLDQQVFTVVNNERVDRGLPPIDYLTSQLDAYAQNGANADGDPPFPTAVTGGAPITYGGSIWAGGLTSVLCATHGGKPQQLVENSLEFPRIKPGFVYFSPAMQRQASQLVRNADVLHGHGLYVGTNYIFGREARRRGKPLVYHVQGMFEPYILRRSSTERR